MTGAGPTITVLLADDQAMIRQALSALLQLEPDIAVVGQAGDVAETVRRVREIRPEVVLLDVQMPSPDVAGADGIDACAAIMAEVPSTRVIILTTFGRPGYLRRAMEAGAVGYMVKDAPAEQLVEGIRRVHQGLRVVDPTLAAASLSIGASPLTSRELEVLVAADLVSQAEHDPLAAAVLVTDSEPLADRVQQLLPGQVDAAKHGERIRTAMGGRQSCVELVDEV